MNLITLKKIKFLCVKNIIILFIVTISSTYSQTLNGIVSDSLNNPLENANIIAMPKSEKATLKFAISDNKGRFRLELEDNVSYQITTSYIGYNEQVFLFEANSDLKTYNFILIQNVDQLEEIFITHEYKPIIIKKDTLIYDVKAFTNGNERKLKDQLEKLPGVEVDKNGVITVQGKKVTQFLVENKSFFGGGTKLGVENIPADAVDKVEVLDHFNEVDFMKQVSDSDELAMNIKLKEDKKKFVFGDIEAGIGFEKYYLAHAGLFYYSPKANISFIGDTNNIGKSTFTFQDLMRFDGGISSYLTGRKSLSNLYEFANDNSDVIQNKSQFGALNFNVDTFEKVTLSGFGIVSKVLIGSRTENQNDYLQNNTISFENQLQSGDSRSVLGIGNLKLEYSPNKKEKWYYNAQLQSSTNDITSTINSITDINQNHFKTIRTADNVSVKQYIEWHKSISDNQTATFVINQAYEKITPRTNWFADQPFLNGLIPLQTDDNYIIDQVKNIKNNSIDLLFKHYWIINNYNHLYTIVGNNYGYSTLETSEKQLLSDGSMNDFAAAGFGNKTKYQLNDSYLGFEYKFKIGKLINKPGLYFHVFSLKNRQQLIDNNLTKTLFHPQWNSEYEFNTYEKLTFNYKLANTFPEVNQLANQFVLQNYNSVFKGNALLENERFHAATLSYTKMSMYKGIMITAFANFNKKVKTTRNVIELEGVNQFFIPLLLDNPETNYRFYGSVSKKIYRFSFKLNSSLNWFNYIQTLNNVITTNNRSNQDIGGSIKTTYKKWPDFSIGYTKGFSQFSGITKSNFNSDTFTSDIDIEFFKNWIFNFEYENVKNTNEENQSNYFDIANTSLLYQKKDSAFGFELSINNILDIKSKNNYSFSDFVISQRQTFVLPRIFLFSVNYKL